MKLKFLLGLAIGWFNSSKVAAQLFISPGTDCYVQGNLPIVLQDMDFVNNGNFNHSGGVIRFSGSLNSLIGGEGVIFFNNLEVAKENNKLLQLNKHIIVRNEVNFLSGFIDLNGFILNLDSYGLLSNESEASRIIGVNGGIVRISTILNAPTAVNPGNLGAVISSSKNLGTVTISRAHQPQQVNGGGTSSINRYFDISPSANKNLDAIFRFQYFDAELNGFDENQLEMWRKHNGPKWMKEEFTTRNSVDNYVEKTGIRSFSQWTLSDADGNAIALITAARKSPDNIEPDRMKEFKLFPNPATHFLDVQWTSKNTSQSTIRILNAEGRVVKTLTTKGAVNNQRISLDGLAKGIYMLVLKTGSDQQVSKFVIQ
jgi:hypothetical protein